MASAKTLGSDRPPPAATPRMAAAPTTAADGRTPQTTRSTTRSTTRWGAAVGAGLIAGLVFMAGQMLLVWLVQGASPWGPPRIIAAMALGQRVLPPPDTFALLPVVVAMILHFIASAVYGVLIGWLVHRFDRGAALAIGLMAGLAIYGINFYLVAPFVFPWFVDARNAVSAVMHAVFGIVAAGAYVALRGRQSGAARWEPMARP